MPKTYINKDAKILKIALIGNPNSGKTTLFNQLTGSSQFVGNWPGVTVEKKEGIAKFKDKILKIIDLPGVYSLSPYSSEEIVTRNYLTGKDVPDVIINIVDSTNIERNFYLTTQILEMGIPVIVALNMIDLLYKKGDNINFKKLSSKFGIPFVSISASKGKGLDNLINKTIFCFDNKIKFNNFYDNKVSNIIKEIQKILGNENPYSRWNAIKIFEDDPIILKSLKIDNNKLKKLEALKNSVKTSKNIDRQIIVADQRYKYICDVCSNVIIKKKSNYNDETISDKIDKILTHKIFAFPIFFFFIFLTFNITFGSFGNFFKELISYFIDKPLTYFVVEILDKANVSVWAKGLVLDGILKGVGAAASFLPQIIILFTFLSFLEGTGYMSRCAFIMDRLFKKLGLSGHSFIPMLMGFGCTVPAVMGTRIIEKERDKFLTIFIIPFMSCSAKITIYSMIVSTFFKNEAPFVIFILYLIGIIVAIVSAFILKKTGEKDDEASFIMELPSYKIPTFKTLFLRVFDSIKDFLKRAGTVLVSCSVMVWFLENFDMKFNMVKNGGGSILANFAEFISPVFRPCGFTDWKISVSLIAGLAAKESVVSTMAVLYGTGDSSELSAILSGVFTKASAFSFMIFVLLYTPCFAAISAMKKELGSNKMTFFAVCYQLFVAWSLSVFAFLICSFIF